MNYFEKILYLYPEIQGVSFWETQYDGTEWEDPYDGIVWENEVIEKPTKEELDSLDESIVKEALQRRKEHRNLIYKVERIKEDINGKAAFFIYKKDNPEATLIDFVKHLDSIS